MALSWDVIGDKIYGILAAAGYGIQMRDEKGANTMDPHEAVRFLATIKSKNPQLDTFNVLIGLHDEDAYSHLDFRTPKTVDDADFDIITVLKNSIQKNLGDIEGLKINWTPFGSTITFKDDPNKKISESKDISKVYGTTKSSFQRVGESKLIIRHTDIVDESKQGSRWRKIRAVFIETKDGERFKYPQTHVSGARAMARHLSEGGNINDVIGQSISRMSEEYLQLKHARKLLHSSGKDEDAQIIREAIKDLNHKLRRVSGPRGYRGINEMLSKHDVHDIQSATDKSKQLLIDCQCTDDADKNALTTAAKYITIKVQVPNNQEKNNVPEWLAPMLTSLTAKLSDQEQLDRLMALSHDVDDGIMPNIDDIHWVTDTAKTINQPKTNPEIIRIKELSGI
jgi:hypothetical protein